MSIRLRRYVTYYDWKVKLTVSAAHHHFSSPVDTVMKSANWMQRYRTEAVGCCGSYPKETFHFDRPSSHFIIPNDRTNIPHQHRTGSPWDDLTRSPQTFPHPNPMTRCWLAAESNLRLVMIWGLLLASKSAGEMLFWLKLILLVHLSVVAFFLLINNVQK